MKQKIELGVNLNCFTNRYVMPSEWTEKVADLGIHHVQFNADILDPALPWAIQERIIKETLSLCLQNGIIIHSSFGGHNHHQNYLGHPDAEIAGYYENFYKRMIKQTSLLGGAGTGTCYAIMTVNSFENPVKRKDIIHRAARAYHRLADYAKKEGLSYLMFETTSTPRETCATFEETDYVLGLLNGAAVPFRLCLDVGHRNMNPPLCPESDTCNWIKKYGYMAPVIHIQQTDNHGSNHWPFNSEFNAKGVIVPEQIISAIRESGAKETLLAFELNHKAFYPQEHYILRNLEESVNYWRNKISYGQ